MQEDGPQPDQVCVLAVPGDMSFAEFSKFLGSYTEQVASMRLVRRDDKAKSVCMALLQFRSGPNAADFVGEYNGRPFSDLEPDIICRAVLITAVTTYPASGSTSKQSSAGTLAKPGPGLVELPTCPVCLERLDQHISGIITTVRALAVCQCNYLKVGALLLASVSHCCNRLGCPHHLQSVHPSCMRCRFVITAFTTNVCKSGAILHALYVAIVLIGHSHPVARFVKQQLTCGSVSSAVSPSVPHMQPGRGLLHDEHELPDRTRDVRVPPKV
jgi:BRCA1-associated protein 2